MESGLKAEVPLSPSIEPVWNMVFFKVENKIFARPRSEFVRTSPVFADMFRLPAENPEGRDQDHPIVLEGYKADEFEALLNVIYPTTELLLFKFKSTSQLDMPLNKKEWISVLKLSTVWNMEQIREYAIHKLSSEDISLHPAEMIQLARAHRVAKWLEEGITSLVDGRHMLRVENMPGIGYETAALIFLIREQASREKQLRFSKSSLRCIYCTSSEPIRPSTDSCYNCNATLGPDEMLVHPSHAFGTVTNSGVSERMVELRSINCGLCLGNAFRTNCIFCCDSCGKRYAHQDHVRVTPNKEVREMIEDFFGKEIEEYRGRL